jgi:hypothetical protein
MIRAVPAWWSLRIVVESASWKWIVEPDRPSVGLWDRLVHPRWTGRWAIHPTDTPTAVVGSVRVTPNLPTAMAVELGTSAVSIPIEGGSKETFSWAGHTFRLCVKRGRLEEDGATPVIFGGRGYAVFASDYPRELEQFVGALATGVVLHRLITATSMPSGTA